MPYALFPVVPHLSEKGYIKTTNYQELAKAILFEGCANEFAFNEVTSENLWNWFSHCCYCTSSFWERL